MNIRRYLLPAKYELQSGVRKLQCYLYFMCSLVVRPCHLSKQSGKKTAWERWKLFNDVTEAFLTLNKGLEDIDKETRCLLWWSMNLLYDKTSPQTSINLLRKELFTRGRRIEKIPPTLGNYSSMTKEQRIREVNVGVKWQKNKCCFHLQICGDDARKTLTKTMCLCGRFIQ